MTVLYDYGIEPSKGEAANTSTHTTIVYVQVATNYEILANQSHEYQH